MDTLAMLVRHLFKGARKGRQMLHEQKWNNSNLGDYLLYDYWSPQNALCVLVGFDYYAKLDDSGDVDPALTLDSFSYESAIHGHLDAKECDSLLKSMRNDFNRLHNFWHSGGKEDVGESPVFFIEWALSKRFRPAWLDWAIERGLYTPKQEIITNKSLSLNDKLLTPNERNTLLTIIAALCDYSAINLKERGATAQITKLTEDIGAPVSDDAVGKALKKIPDALQSRMK